MIKPTKGEILYKYLKIAKISIAVNALRDADSISEEKIKKHCRTKKYQFKKKLNTFY